MCRPGPGRRLDICHSAAAFLPVRQWDGYALREADIKGACQEQPIILKVIYKTCAGDPPGRRLLPGECVRIMTGAVLPEGADCVIRQEDTDEGESRVRIYSRRAGTAKLLCGR